MSFDSQLLSQKLPSSPEPSTLPQDHLLNMTLSVIFGNLTTIVILAILYLNYLLFQPYIQLIVWSFTLSQILRKYKNKIKDKLASVDAATTSRRSDGETATLKETMLDAVLSYLMQPQAIVDSFIDNSFVAFTFLALLKLLYAYATLPVFVALASVFSGFVALVLWLDRSLVFFYRRFLSDDLLSTILALLLFLVTTLFITGFLMTQATLDGALGAKAIGTYLHSEATHSVALSTHWDSGVTAVNDAAVSAYATVTSSYGNETWFASVNETISAWFVNDTFVLLLDSDEAPELCDARNAFGDTCDIDLVTTSTAAHSVFETIDFKSLKLRVANLNISTDQIATYLNVAAATAGGGAAMISDTLKILGTIIDNISDAIIKVVMFVTFLVLLLQTPSDILTTLILELTPTRSVSTKLAISTAIRESLMGVLMMPLRLASAHSCCMVIFLTAGGGNYVFFSALLCFMHAIAPVAPSYLICIPWIIVWIVKRRYITAILVLVAIKSSIGYTDDRLFTMHSSSINPLFTSLSILMGFKAFGVQGVLVGPLCLTLMNLMRVGVSVAETINQEGRVSPSTPINTSRKRASGLKEMLFGVAES